MKSQIVAPFKMGWDSGVEQFIERWANRLVTERSQCHSFIIQLCAVIGVDAPDARRVGDPAGGANHLPDGRWFVPDRAA